MDAWRIREKSSFEIIDDPEIVLEIEFGNFVMHKYAL